MEKELKITMPKQTRHTETKNHIKRALSELLTQKHLEQISVTEICKTAKINRGTFYLHYKDKYDMMEKIREEKLSNLYRLITQENLSFSKEIICETLQYIQQDIAFLRVLATISYVNFSPVMRDFIGYILDNIPGFDTYIVEKLAVPLNYAKASYIASIESLLHEWIVSGGQESPEELTEIIVRIAQ